MDDGGIVSFFVGDIEGAVFGKADAFGLGMNFFLQLFDVENSACAINDDE